jgi:Rrf2 family protein
MIFTKRSDYGLRAAMELAAGFGRGPLSARQIAQRGNLPEPFVRKLMQELTQAGLAASERGRRGGYVLVRAPGRVSVRETLEAFESLAPVPCLDVAGTSATARSAAASSREPAERNGASAADDGCTLEISESCCPARAAWHLVDRRVRETLDDLTLEDLLREVRRLGLTEELIHAG